MKTKIGILTIILWMVGHVCAAEVVEDILDGLLKKHLAAGSIGGVALTLVDYAGWKNDPRYGQVLAALKKSRPDTLAGDNLKSFWINAYNILAVKMVIEHYPVESIKDAGSFFSPVWDKDVITIREKTYSLGEIEHEILRPMGDARIHAAIVCASVSCPDLRTEAFRAERLDEQLDDQMKRFLANTKKGFAEEGGDIRISSIFKWFSSDFESAGGILPFLRRYGKDTLADEAGISYFKYDWSLNDRSRLLRRED